MSPRDRYDGSRLLTLRASSLMPVGYYFSTALRLCAPGTRRQVNELHENGANKESLEILLSS